MNTSRWLCAALFVLALVPAAATADDIRESAPIDLLSSAGEIVFPSEWGGVWQVSDSIYDCQDQFLRVEAREEALCPGSSYYPGWQGVPTEIGSGIPFDCDGAISDTDLNAICDAFIPLGLGGCIERFDLQVDARLDGNTLNSVKTFRRQRVGSNCGDNPNAVCRIVRSTAIRVGPTPKSCGTTVERATWGSVKVRYR